MGKGRGYITFCSSILPPGCNFFFFFLGMDDRNAAAEKCSESCGCNRRSKYIYRVYVMNMREFSHNDNSHETRYGETGGGRGGLIIEKFERKKLFPTPSR